MIRLILAALLILPGLLALGTATLGIFRFSTMLNRIHAASVCDTMGALLVLSGLILLSGLNALSLKLLLTLVFLWLGSPVSSHLVARMELRAHPHVEQICDFLELSPDGTLSSSEAVGEELVKREIISAPMALEGEGD